MTGKCPEDLRSHRWYGATGVDYRGKPVIAILNTWSGSNPCHTHSKQRVEEIKPGSGRPADSPVEMPAMSLSEPFQTPTTMLYRNLRTMETARPRR